MALSARQEMQQPEAAKCKRLRALRYEYTDVSLLRLLLAVLHSGPQLLFQLCLLVQRGQLPLPEGEFGMRVRELGNCMLGVEVR